MHFVRAPTLIIVIVFVIISSNITGELVEAKPNGCKYWCRNGKRYYCCGDGKKGSEIISWMMEEFGVLSDYFWYLVNPWPILFKREMSTDWVPHEYLYHMEKYHEKEGSCPEARPYCPRYHDWEHAPLQCHGDDECYHQEKCCFDICLEHKTCKPPIFMSEVVTYK